VVLQHHGLTSAARNRRRHCADSRGSEVSEWTLQSRRPRGYRTLLAFRGPGLDVRGAASLSFEFGSLRWREAGVDDDDYRRRKYERWDEKEPDRLRLHTGAGRDSVRYRVSGYQCVPDVCSHD